jgi:hypothetical protein
MDWNSKALKLSLAFGCALVLICAVGASPTPRGTFIQRDEILDQNGRYRAQWKYYPEEKLVEFEISSETKGFVGFGISPVGGMTGADIVIGGVYPNGTTYFNVNNYEA